MFSRLLLRLIRDGDSLEEPNITKVKKNNNNSYNYSNNTDLWTNNKVQRVKSANVFN